MTTVDFSTFCYAGDAHRLHKPGQLKLQVESNSYSFDEILIIHQLCDLSGDYPPFPDCNFQLNIYVIKDLDEILIAFDIDIDKPQYVSPTDKAHTWKNHTANHLAAVQRSSSDYIVFADNDCWMIKQPDSWAKRGIEILEQNPDVFIVSPNDGEPERKTQVISQQMFMARTDEFRQADFNQPGWDGNPHVIGGPFPEYWALLEGRIGLYCKHTNKYRYVLPPEYRYFHHNRLNEDGTYKTNYSDYGL
mgnify:CR=1 FL=1